MADLESLINETARKAEHLNPTIATFFILSLVLSSLLNGAVLIVIYHQQNLQDYMRVLYQILTASELILGITWSLWSMLWLSFRDHKTCSVASMVFPFLTFVALWSVMACLCGISFNLYLLVTRPLRYHTIVTRKRFVCILVRHLLGDSAGLWNRVSGPRITYNYHLHKAMSKSANATKFGGEDHLCL